MAMHTLTSIPLDISATKDVFVSAIRFATSTGGSCPPFGDKLKISAQEQVEFMLQEDKDTPTVTADEEVKSVVRMGLSKIFWSFEQELSSLQLGSDLVHHTAEDRILQRLSDLEWICNILPRLNLMKEFVSNWAAVSGRVVGFIEDKKLDYVMWGLKLKLIELTGKVLEAVGYGNVILPAPCRAQLLKTWLPFIRKLKTLLDSKAVEEEGFPYKMEEDLCQSIEGAVVTSILALPSNDQADILADWMKCEHIKYPDLSEAFELWCYRSKAATRRLTEGSDSVADATISL